MSLSDPIGDMIARVKNAQSRNHKIVELPSSNFKFSESLISLSLVASKYSVKNTPLFLVYFGE